MIRELKIASRKAPIVNLGVLDVNAVGGNAEHLVENFGQARRLLSAGKYADALSILVGIEERKSTGEIGSHLLFLIYTDLESCYRELGDFERAYRYSGKRLSLFSAFRE